MMRAVASRGLASVPRRRKILVATASTAIVLTTAASATLYYASPADSTTNGGGALTGLQRQGTFWVRVVPVIWDYYWNFASSSPYVRYQKWRYTQSDHADTNADAILQQQQQQQQQQQRSQQLAACHERHAPEILQVMLDLKGLFIKLGQVLSVTALPLPEPYRIRFRTLQDKVDGHEPYATIEKILKDEFKQPLDDIFESIDEEPIGAASIGQAHRATLKETGEQVVIKIQYPDAAWKVPADIQCVGDFMKVCVWAGVLDEDAARMSYQEFSRQFLNELDYISERNNLQTIYESSLDPKAPYRKRGVVVPRVFDNLCTSKVITMSYLPGSKLEEEARRQLAMLGIDMERGIADMVRDSAREATADSVDESEPCDVNDAVIVAKRIPRKSLVATMSQVLGRTMGLDAILYSARLARRLLLWSTAFTVYIVQKAAPVLPSMINDWAEAHKTVIEQVRRLSLTASWIDGLFDVHGHQIFTVGLFNADCHPGNILVLDEDYTEPSKRARSTQQIGLIDFGQCKRLTLDEQLRIARLIQSVANNESDEAIASSLRALSIETKNDSTYFLAEFARLMFGTFQPQHMDQGWHRKLHEIDKVTYFPNELAMVYRTSLLLRGLAVSLQVNPSVAQQWRHHAEDLLRQHS